jgi:hypothetical protein
MSEENTNSNINGRLYSILPLQKGTNKNGKQWEKKQFIIETTGQYPKRICFDMFGNKIFILDKISIGTEINVTYEIESNEWNGKWFTSVKCLTITMDEELMIDEPKINVSQILSKEETNIDDSESLPF